MNGDADGSAATLPRDALVDGSTSSSGSAIIDAANDARRYVLHRERHLRAALGTYRFFVYAGAPFDAMSSELLLPGYNSTYVGVPGVGIEPSKPLFAEYTAPVWIHRALLSDSSSRPILCAALPGHLGVTAFAYGATYSMAECSATITSLPTEYRY